MASTRPASPPERCITRRLVVVVFSIDISERPHLGLYVGIVDLVHAYGVAKLGDNVLAQKRIALRYVAIRRCVSLLLLCRVRHAIRTTIAKLRSFETNEIKNVVSHPGRFARNTTRNIGCITMMFAASSMPCR